MSAFDDSILDLPFYEPRHRTLAAELRRWTAEHAGLPARLASLDPSARGVHYTCLLGREGWLRCLFDAPAGGRPDLRTLCLVRQAFAHFDDLCDFAFSIHGLACAPLLWWGDADAHESRVALLRGERIGALALTEPQAGSNLAAVETAARRSGEGYVLDGRKAWISNADIADFHCVLARTGEGPGALGLSLLHVPADSAGLLVDGPVPMLAPRALGHLQFQDCRIDSPSLIGEPGQGYRYAMEVLDFFRVSVAAAALGFCRRAASAAVGWSRTRRVAGGALFDMQLTKGKLADMAVYLDAAALLTARAAWAFDCGQDGATLPASAAKLYATEQAQQVVDDALQLFGAAGLAQGATAEQLYRQIRSLRVYEGTSEMHRLILSAGLARQLARPAATLPAETAEPA